MLAELSPLQTDASDSDAIVKEGRHIVIVGGGASGAPLACHLLRSLSENIRVTLIEKNPAIGRGIAFGTADPAHLLNVRAANIDFDLASRRAENDLCGIWTSLEFQKPTM
jgi:ribulose 1,5-bisphosphate synthetase/thiazole synthase